MIIKECIIFDDDETGVSAISFVNQPATEELFIAMGKEDIQEIELANSEYYKYTAEPNEEIIETSHEFCKLRAGKVFHISEIRAWGGLDKKLNGFIDDSDFFLNFTGDGSANVDQQLFNCRHWLKKVRVKDAPDYKQKMFSEKNIKDNFKFEFSNVSDEKREVTGLALKSGQLIFRKDVLGEPGYIYFTRETIRKIFKKFGYNRTITYDHSVDRTGDVILMKSYLEENEDLKETRWIVKYKVVSDKLWKEIKDQTVKGFSVEIDVRLK